MSLSDQISALKKIKKNIVMSCEVCGMEVKYRGVAIIADRKAKEFDRQHNQSEHMAKRKPLWKKRLGKIAGIPAMILEFFIELFS